MTAETLFENTMNPTIESNVLVRTGYAISRPGGRSDMERRMLSAWGRTGPAWDRDRECLICGCGCEHESVQAGFIGDPETGEMHSTVITSTICDECSALAEEHFDAPPELHPHWTEKCPPRMQEWVLRGGAEFMDAQWFRQVVEWRPDESGYGLVIRGDSGSGKTTAVWSLIRECEMERGIRARFINAVQLFRDCARTNRDLSANWEILKCRLMCIDDLGKEPITRTWAATLWELIDYRYAHKLPTVITTRYKGIDLESRFDDQAGEVAQDIIGRIREANTAIMAKDKI